MRNKIVTVAILSFSVTMLEIIQTRIFSAEFYYTFAFLIISIALLGLGLGGLVTRLFKKINNVSYLPLFLIIFSISSVLAPIGVFELSLDFSKSIFNSNLYWKIISAVILLAIPFINAGMSLSLIFKTEYNQINSIYMYDMIGGGIGIFVAVLSMNIFSTPIALAFVGLPSAILAMLILKKKLKWVAIFPIALISITAIYSHSLFKLERKEKAKIIYQHWDAMSKIKVFEYDSTVYGINLDNAANTPCFAFSGKISNDEDKRFKFSINVKNLINEFADTCTFLSLGAGGGSDVLQALQEGATEIHAVEINSHVNYMMKEGFLKDFSGNLYNNPKVQVITEDARAYVRANKNKFDIIYSLSSNTFSALASGSFALAENYLFTKEAFIDYWNALSENGYLMMEHQFYMPRIVSTLMEALDELELENPQNYIAVYNLPKLKRNFLYLSKQPLNDNKILTAFGIANEKDDNWFYPLYPQYSFTEDNIIAGIVENGWKSQTNYSDVDISPVTDNKPFIAQMGLWKNFNPQEIDKILPYEFYGYPLAKLIILAILFSALLLVLPLNFIPYIFKSEKLRLYPWLYFFTIGIAFMMLEVVLIQKYTLFVGPTLWSVTSIIASLLVFAGIGSRFASRVGDKEVFVGIITWLILERFLFSFIAENMGGMRIGMRIMTMIFFVAPLGFFMGIPFPKGVARVKNLSDWGFAINGLGSVIGSALILLISFEFGFNIALTVGSLVYILSYFLLINEKKWESR